MNKMVIDVLVVNFVTGFGMFILTGIASACLSDLLGGGRRSGWGRIFAILWSFIATNGITWNAVVAFIRWGSLPSMAKLAFCTTVGMWAFGLAFPFLVHGEEDGE